MSSEKDADGLPDTADLIADAVERATKSASITGWNHAVETSAKVVEETMSRMLPTTTPDERVIAALVHELGRTLARHIRGLEKVAGGTIKAHEPNYCGSCGSTDLTHPVKGARCPCAGTPSGTKWPP